MIPRTSGGAYRRPGTFHVDSLSMASYHAPRVIPFIFSRNEAYGVVLTRNVGGAAIAFSYRATSNRSGGGVTTAVTGTPPYIVATVTTGIAAAAAGYPNGLGCDDEIFQIQYCQSADVLYLTHPLRKPQKVIRTALDTFKICGFDTDAVGTTLTGFSLVQSYPYLNQNVTAQTMTPAATTGSGINLTSSTSNFFVAGHVGAIFVLNQSGTIGAIQITSITSGTVAVGTVLATFGGTGAVTTFWESAWSDARGWPSSCEIFQQRLAMGGTTHQPDSTWFSKTYNFGTFSHLGGNSPGFTGTLADGTTVNIGSGTILYTTDTSEGDGQTTGPRGEQAFRITLSQNTLDKIQWMSADKELLIGTTANEWVIAPQNGDFSVANSPTVLQSKYGSDDVQAIRIGYELIFPMVTQDEVRAYQYNYIDASFFAEPVQLLFDQYPKPDSGPYSFGRRKFRQISWDSTRNTLWCLDTAGNFFGMTRDRKLNVTMWHTHQFGGYDTTKGSAQIGSSGSATIDPSYAACDGSVISFAVIPNVISGVNDIWLIVKRTIASTVTWQLERIIGKDTVRETSYTAIYPGTSSTEPYCLDACVSGPDVGDPTNFSVAAQTAGVAYLNGHTSLVGTYYSFTNGLFKLTTGAVSAGDATIVSGGVPNDYGTLGNFMAFGLPYTPIIAPVRVDSGSVIGTAQAAILRINRCFVRMFKSLSMSIGSTPPKTNAEDQNGLAAYNFKLSTAGAHQSAEVFTGLQKVLLNSTYDRESTLYITCADPFPFSVTSIVSEGETFD